MNLSDSILERGLASDSSQLALTREGETWTFARLRAESERTAGALAARGVGKGSRVAIMMENRPEYLSTLFGCAHLGAILATINLEFRASEIRYILDNAEPSVVVTDSSGARAFAAATSSGGLECPALELCGGASEPMFGDSFRDAVAAAPEVGPCAMAPEDPVLILYTSGTSAEPKAVLCTHGAEAWSAAAHAAVWGIGPEDTAVVPLTLAWAYGLATVTLSCLSAGSRAVLLPRFHPEALAAAIARERATLLFGVTTMFVMLRQFVEEAGEPVDMTSIRLALSAGERRDEETFRWFEDATGAAVSDAYAMSEVRPVMTYDPRVDPRPRPEACGRLVPGVEARLVGPDGEPVPRGEPGEAWLRSPGMFAGYFRQPELAAERLDANGWFGTGDILREDGDGYWYFVARSGELIRRAGANISPVEVQNVLARHPLVEDAAVVGIPDPLYGEAVAAVVVGAHGVAADEVVRSVRTYAREQLAEFKVPSVLRCVPAIPQTATGKFKRREIVELLAAGRTEAAVGGD